MSNATAFWGFAGTVAAPSCISNSGISTVSTPGTCDGNSSGVLSGAGAANATGELYQYWKQLALAGLIEGQYSGIAGPGGSAEVIIGTTAPRSKLGNAGWSVWVGTNYVGNGAAFAYDYGQVLHFGTQVATEKTQGYALKPEEIWNIDTKIDDGKPATGKILPYNWPGCTTAASNSDSSAEYKLTNTATACAVIFARAF